MTIPNTPSPAPTDERMLLQNIEGLRRAFEARSAEVDDRLGSPSMREMAKARANYVNAVLEHGELIMGRALAHPHGDAGGWRPAPAPKDAPFWAYLYTAGIMRMRWWTPEECAADEGGVLCDYDGAYCTDEGDEWAPDWWLPIDALPSPPEGAGR